MIIGVLALQGAFAKHIAMLRSLGVEAVEVRKSSELAGCDGLIIPGGESTAIMRLLREGHLLTSLPEYAKSHPVFGTCAGLILMSQEVLSESTQPLGLLEVSVERNAFGSQADSFRAVLDIQFEGKQRCSFPALFIRAPRIRRCGAHIEVLASYEGEPVFVKQGRHLGATFHPELTDNPAIHDFFLKLIKFKGRGG